MRDVVEELRRASEAAFTPKELSAVLARMLEELVSLDMGMIGGVVVPKQTRDSLVAAIGALAHSTFTRFVTHRSRAREWLGELPLRSRPRCIDLAPWHAELDVPTDEAGRHAWMREYRKGRITALLAPGGGDGPITIERIESIFATALPESLRTAWGEALAHADKSFLLGTLAELLRTATFISEEQLAYENVADAPGEAPFALLPLASTGGPDYIALELATGRVVTCEHDIDELGGVWPSADAWLAARGR